MKAWNLFKEDEILGTLTLLYVDQPFFHCSFEPTQIYQCYKPLFDSEIALLEEDDMEAWEVEYSKIDELGLLLKPKGSGEIINDFLLHIEGDTAWFRY